MTATAPETTTQPTIRLATPADRDNVIAALTSGFSDDVIISGWLFNDPQTYTRYARDYFACYTDFAIEHGYVWTTGDPSGAFVALPFRAWQLAQQDAALKARIEKATGPYAERVFVLDQALADRHPAVPDHLYPAFLGVAPGHRSMNIGPDMIREFFQIADRLQLPIYGEASTERNSRLYTLLGVPRHGDPISLPGCSTQILPFWRSPAPRPGISSVRSASTSSFCTSKVES